MNNKKSQLFWSIWNIIQAFILFGAGVLCILFRDNQELLSVIGYVVGAFVISDGALRIALFFTGFKKSEDSDVLVGGFEAAIGIVICLQHAAFIEILVQFLYCLLFIIGGLILAMAILKIIKHKSTMFMPILTIVFGAILCGLGLAIFIIYELTDDQSKVLIMILIGAILMLVGGAQFVITLIQTLKATKKKNEIVPQEEVKEETPTVVQEEQPTSIENKEVVEVETTSK